MAISAEYRIKNVHGTSPRECVKDGKSAVRYLRKNAAALGIDPDRIVAGRGSAGGHVAAATATLSNYEESGEDLSVSSRPNAPVLFNPVYDNGPDGDGVADGAEVANGTDPTTDEGDLGTRLLGVEFNRDDALASPSQSLYRVVSGSTSQSANAATYSKVIAARQVTVSQPGGVNLEFRGANSDSSRAIPGGDTSLSFLVADFIATREGAIDLEITHLPAGDYVFRSFHLDSCTGSGLGFAQGSTATSANMIEARLGGVVQASVQPTALGADGLGTTFIDDSQVPTLSFTFTHDGSSPLAIELRATESNGSENFLLLNGFELFLSDTP